jgi:hypothetical protein
MGAFKDLHPGQTGSPQFDPGFPGFNPTASETLAYIAGMQEAGIPVTYAYISDVHDKKFPNGSTTRPSGCTTPGNAMGPAATCYKANLAAYDAAYDASFATFFQRLAANGIDPSNTLFIFSAEEQDHYAGAAPTPILDSLSRRGCRAAPAPTRSGAPASMRSRPESSSVSRPAIPGAAGR